MSRPSFLALLVGAWVLVPLAEAQTPPADESTYAMTTWAPENGEVPVDVFAIAQDARGYLWLGTPAGLVRFDGDQFRRWPVRETDDPLPDAPVHALVGASDGSVWAGVGAGGGVVRILDGEVTLFGSDDGAPSVISAMIQDRRGAIWAAARRGLFRFADGGWTTIGGEDDLAGIQAFSLFEDSRGGIWVGSAAGVFRIDDGSIELVDATAVQVDAIVEDRSGAIWISDFDRFVRRVTTRETPVPGPGVRGPAGAWRALVDSSGQMWVATWASLMRIDHPEQAEPAIRRVAYEQRMAGSPRALFEDRDRNIWVGMRGGLLRLGRASVTAVDSLEGLTNEGVRTTAVGADGTIWAATAYGLNRFTGASRAAYNVARIMALHGDRSGLWVSTPERFGRFEHERFVPVSVPGAFHPRRVLAMTTDARGTLWLCSSLDGPTAWDGVALQRFDSFETIFNRACRSVFSDSRGRVWIGFLEGGVAVYDHGTFTTFDESDGLSPGTVLSILEDQRGAMWMITPAGLDRYADGRFLSLTRDDIPLVDIVPVLLEDDDGYLWVGVNSGAGIVRVHPRQVDEFSTGSSPHLEYALFDETDGMQQGAQAWQAGVGGVRGADGRLWVATGVGMAIIDPQRLPMFRRPLPPRVESVIVDGRRHDAVDGERLPSGTSTVEFEYGSVHLSAASKLRYRYRLDPFDDDWVSARGVRSARYTGLPPGNYRFQVSATDTGHWTDESLLAFSVAPPFYRTSQFIGIALLGTFLLLVAGWWLRLRAVQRQYSLVFAERARVSREIHDTLLQSLAAIGVELETIATQVEPSHSVLRGELGRLRRRVGHALRDARDSVLELRRSPMHRQSLADALRVSVHDVHARQHVPVAVAVHGRPRPTVADVDAQLVRIAQEAVNNARKHGRASRIEVTLSYETDHVLVRIVDDGCGFDREAVESPAAVGEHLGLLTMQERASRIGGRLTIDSRPGSGTTVELRLPRAAEGTEGS